MVMDCERTIQLLLRPHTPAFEKTRIEIMPKNCKNGAIFTATQRHSSFGLEGYRETISRTLDTAEHWGTSWSLETVSLPGMEMWEFP
jgi:hypothetical protein